MIDKLKEWSGVVALVAIIILTWAIPSPGEMNLAGNGSRFTNGLSTDSTSPVDGEVRTTSLTVTSTSTITSSPDGFVIGGTISMAATGTVRTLYTNTTGPKYCDGSTSFLYVNSSAFSPSIVFSMGTSTTATAAPTNLVASTTIATTTDTLVAPSGGQFILPQGAVLNAIFGDITNTEASSTHFSNWTAEAGVWCQNVAI